MGLRLAENLASQMAGSLEIPRAAKSDLLKAHLMVVYLVEKRAVWLVDRTVFE